MGGYAIDTDIAFAEIKEVDNIGRFYSDGPAPQFQPRQTASADVLMPAIATICIACLRPRQQGNSGGYRSSLQAQAQAFRGAGPVTCR